MSHHAHGAASLVVQEASPRTTEGAALSLIPPLSPNLMSSDDFKAAFRNHPSGVGVIAADPGTGPVAMTVSSVFSVSAEPPILVFSASELSSSTPSIRASATVVVHLLSADELWLATLCATSGSDRFGRASSGGDFPRGSRSTRA